MFCEQTSLHGWQYIAQSHTSNAKHLFWAIIVSLSMATASYFLYNNTVNFLDATVRFKVFFKMQRIIAELDINFVIALYWICGSN